MEYQEVLQKQKEINDDETKTADDNISLYSHIADSYNKSQVGLNYKGYEVAAKHVARLMNGDKRMHILDIGAGTGLVGQQLHQYGFHNIDAIDGSSGMLEKAKKLNVYQRMICDKLATNKLDIQDDTYDCLVGAAMLGPKHVRENCFDELIRITKKGGYVVIVRKKEKVEDTFCKEHIEPRIKYLHEAHKWKLIDTIVADGYYKTYLCCTYIMQKI